MSRAFGIRRPIRRTSDACCEPGTRSPSPLFSASRNFFNYVPQPVITGRGFRAFPDERLRKRLAAQNNEYRKPIKRAARPKTFIAYRATGEGQAYLPSSVLNSSIRLPPGKGAGTKEKMKTKSITTARTLRLLSRGVTLSTG